MSDKQPVIIKFGTVSEEDGILAFKGFHIDCTGLDKCSFDYAILFLVKQRIEREMENILMSKIHGVSMALQGLMIGSNIKT